ncbi:hypothetical protein QR680_011759 [Steinernema hermaphroditum]|uniref:ATP-dependent DNA helicase n=1 Tax=Steinernema hermaphroditum TaxID=289476 RepID=A0AA39HZM1_9BILA|nr:hypothetical protein QR680_011759 [Steinernema hermaphroditum]
MSTSEGESTPSTSTKRVRSLRKRRSEVEVDQEREERRQANAQKKREYQARQRATETEEQRRTRLDKDRDRHRQMRAEKKKTAFHIQEPEHLPDVFYLGKRDKRCTFCGALHFVGFHNCCREGRIFINPMKKLWEPLQSLYFNEDHPNRGEFLNKILQYNTLLSMASSQHDRVLQNPFGVQSVKVRGSVHHMPSTLYPENLSHPRYGNVYIYDVNRATEYRMNEIIARDINEDILKELGQQVALCNPYASAYRHMNELLRQQAEAGYTPYNLQDSWRPNIPYISCSDEMNYVDRMVQVKDALLQQGIEIDWTIEVEEMELIPRGIAREIAEIESLMHVDDGGSDESDEEDYQVQQIAYHSDSDEDPDEDEHEIRDEHRNDAVNNEELHFVERNGELYPHRDTVPVVEHEQRLLADYVDDSGDDENPGDQEELLHQISLHPTAAHDTDNIIEDVTNEEDDMRGQQVSYREWLLFNAQYRKGWNNRITTSRKLGQLYVIDHFMRITRQRGENIRRNNTQTTITNKKRFLEFMNDVARRREIKENIPPGETWADHPFLVAEIFKKKLHEFLKDVCGTWKKETPKQKAERIAAKKHKVLRGGMFGDVAWYVYSVEFQQRGMPHAHIVISLAGDAKTKVAQKIDEICQAELPVLPSEGDPEYRRIKRLRDIVEELMMHSPCENNNTAYCRQHTKRHWRTCSKRFPKPFRNFSSLLEDDYALLRRPDNGECSSRNPATNQYVVAYNKKLLLKYEAHINVEIISNLHVLKYLFKYLFKGFNRALIETVERTAVDNGSPIGGIGSMTFTNNIIYPKGIKLPRAVLMERNKAAQKLLMETMNTTVDANNQDILVYDEVSMIEDMRAATSCEAAWEVSAYGTNGSSHSVFTTYIHAPDEETVIVPTGHEEEVLHRIEQQENELPSMLKAWFKINSHPPAGTEDILRDLTFCDMPKYFKYQNKKWVKKARPSEEHVIGRIKSVHPSKTTGTDDKRNGVADQFKIDMYDRRGSSDEQKEARALFHIRSILLHHNRELVDFDLPDINESQLGNLDELNDDGSDPFLTSAQIRERAKDHESKLNDEQKDVFNAILRERSNIYGNRLFFLNGSGGCGKTFLALHEENSEEPFGGVMIIAGGDWKQTLPIVKEVRNEGVLSYTLKKSTLWQRFVQFHLKTNMRAIDDPAYADLLLKIGQGDAQLDEDQVEIPQQTLKNTEDEVINFVFPYNEDWSNRSILTVTNEKSLQLCEMVLNNHPGEARTYESVDKPYKERSFISVEPETYHTLTPPGLPPHRLRLKKGCEVMLLRNLNVKIGLCNGTRLKVLEMKDNLLICAPVNRTERMPEKIAIHRIPMSSSDRPEEEFAFIRHQYPLRLSYSLTINKAQGQSLDKVGLVLPTSCFAHGQLYVALSRAHKQVDIAVTHYRVSDASKRFLLHNIVYKDILQ